MEFLLVLGFIFVAAAFLVRDELLLRALAATGLTCDLIYYALLPTPLWLSVTKAGVTTVINLALIALIIVERTTLFFTPQQREMFAHFPSLQPGQFRRILRHATWHEAPDDLRLVEDGQSLDAFFLVQADDYVVEKAGRRFAAKGPAFVGELVFLSGGTASGSVDLAKGTRYLRLDAQGVRQAMARSSSLKNAMIALLGSDLAQKVAGSVPIAELKDPEAQEVV